MNKQQALEKIEELKKYIDNLDNLGFIEVKKSKREDTLLEDLNGFPIVTTWCMEGDLNDFEYFKKRDTGHFWIYGDVNKFEILINGKWIKCSERVKVRFLK